MIFTVYKHIAPNGKVYIGITSKSPKDRWLNGNGYKTQQLFWRAIQKYGWNNFKSEILFENLTKEEACLKEIELIKFYKSNDSEFGYNVSSGGESGSCGITWSQEARKRQSKLQMGRKHTEETKLKISKNGWTKANKGNIIFSEEHKQKLRNAKESVSKRIMCVETRKIFCSICEASRNLNISKSDIARVCSGERKSAGKLHFKYYTSGEENEIKK